jgi:hypothetical protein
LLVVFRFIDKKSALSEADQVKYKDCKDLDELQRDLDLSILELEIIAPLYFAGAITKTQLHYWCTQVMHMSCVGYGHLLTHIHCDFLQVRLGGPINISSMVDLEAYMVYIKAWAKSRKNISVGMARKYSIAEEVMHAKLTFESLNLPPSFMKTM